MSVFLDSATASTGLDEDEDFQSKELESNKMEQVIPYVVILSHPDYKGSYVDPKFQLSTLGEYKKKIFNKVYRYLFNSFLCNYEINKVTLKTIDNIFTGKSVEYAMSNNSWIAKAFINNKWVDSNPDIQELLDMFIKDKNNNKEYYTDEDDEN
jgi:hypothetical protein